jgi:hypothetical protein
MRRSRHLPRPTQCQAASAPTPSTAAWTMPTRAMLAGVRRGRAQRRRAGRRRVFEVNRMAAAGASRLQARHGLEAGWWCGACAVLQHSGAVAQRRRAHQPPPTSRAVSPGHVQRPVQMGSGLPGVGSRAAQGSGDNEEPRPPSGQGQRCMPRRRHRPWGECGWTAGGPFVWRRAAQLLVPPPKRLVALVTQLVSRAHHECGGGPRQWQPGALPGMRSNASGMGRPWRTLHGAWHGRARAAV